MMRVRICPKTVPAVDLCALSAVIHDFMEKNYVNSTIQRQFEQQMKCEKEEKVECLKRK